MNMKRRQLIYIPKIEPDTFLLFFYKGDTGLSWSLRDYSKKPPKVIYAKELPYSANEILAQAEHKFDAETVSTERVAYWRKETEKLNKEYLS